MPSTLPGSTGGPSIAPWNPQARSEGSGPCRSRRIRSSDEAPASSKHDLTTSGSGCPPTVLTRRQVCRTVVSCASGTTPSAEDIEPGRVGAVGGEPSGHRGELDVRVLRRTDQHL